MTFRGLLCLSLLLPALAGVRSADAICGCRHVRAPRCQPLDAKYRVTVKIDLEVVDGTVEVLTQTGPFRMPVADLDAEVDALAADGRVAIARYVRHGKQHLVALRPQDGRLVMSNLVWADEVVSPADIDEFEGLESVKLTDAELSMADQLIESLAADFEPGEYRDTYREELVDLLNRKAAGEELVRQGFRRVYNIEEGFEGEKDAENHRSTINGWRFRGLPWEQG